MLFNLSCYDFNICYYILFIGDPIFCFQTYLLEYSHLEL
jgi:hypothetical protein